MECKKNKVAIGINDADLTIGSFSRKQHIYSLEFEKQKNISRIKYIEQAEYKT